MKQEIEVQFNTQDGIIKYSTEINMGYNKRQIRNLLRSVAVEEYPDIVISTFSFREEHEIYQ